MPFKCCCLCIRGNQTGVQRFHLVPVGQPVAARDRSGSQEVKRKKKDTNNKKSRKTAEKDSRESEIVKALAPYDLDDGTYVRVSELLLKEMEEGLGKATNAQAIVKMFPTYVRGLPDGSERGNYLALDLGGTNFRVLLITLKGAQVDMKNKIYPISEELMQGHGTKLFDHIAQCIADFMKAHSLHSQHLPLGFTFSFPCKQEGLARGKLVQWTKGFKCEGVEGEDVVQLLHEAIKRRNDINVECVALLNDTVGCLMSCAFLDHNCEIGVILGTGTNACYLEHLDRVQTWDGDRGEPRHVIINTEWGAFGSNGVLDFLRTDADRQIDAESLNPGRQIYEKMISGMYMGELVRLIVVDLLKKKLMFNGTSSPELETIGRFYTKFVSEIEADSEDMRYPQTKQILEELGVSQVSDEDCANLKYICGLVSRRAAFLASAGIATLLNRINKPNITVAVDGSLYRFHPHFHDLMMQKIAQLLSPGLKFQLMLSEDGSGKGAALVAAVSNRLLREKQEKEGKQ